jgi:hypothetical protein
MAYPPPRKRRPSPGANITALLALVTATSFAEAACGDRGGPGYRGPDGKCLSWETLGRVCGSPPSTRCTAEKIAPEASDAARKGQELQEQKKRQQDSLKGSH